MGGRERAEWNRWGKTGRGGEAGEKQQVESGEERAGRRERQGRSRESTLVWDCTATEIHTCQSPCALPCPPICQLSPSFHHTEAPLRGSLRPQESSPLVRVYCRHLSNSWLYKPPLQQRTGKGRFSTWLHPRRFLSSSFFFAVWSWLIGLPPSMLTRLASNSQRLNSGTFSQCQDYFWHCTADVEEPWIALES